MYRRGLPFDAFVCVSVAFVIALGTGWVTEHITRASFEKSVAENAPDAGDVGGIADDAVFRAASIADLRSHDTFTVEVENHNFLTAGTGYLDGLVLKVIILPSGERVAASINYENIRYMDADEIYGGGDVILPVGRLVKEDLAANETVLAQIEHSQPLDATDFYVDMAGSAVLYDEDEQAGTASKIVQVLTVLILYPIFHALGSKYGLWAAYFHRRRTE